MKERPLVYLVPPIAAVLYCAVCLDCNPGHHISLILLSVSMVLAGVTINHERLFTISCMLMAMAAALSYFSIRNKICTEPILLLRGTTIKADAVVISDAEVYETQQRAEIKVSGEHSFKTMCYFPLTDEPLLAGDYVSAHISLYSPGNKEGFDRAAFQAAEGRFISASCALDENDEPYEFSVDRRDEDSLRWLPSRIARHCRWEVKNILPEREAGLLIALLIGDRSWLSEDDELSLRIAGLSHLTAVSGLHIGFLVAFCLMVFGRYAGTWVSIPMVMLFVLVAGATPSVLRAAIMYLAAAGAFLAGRETDALNSLCLALLLLLLWNPYSIASMSLQLSFASTTGLILFAGRLQNRMIKPIKKFPKPVVKIASIIVGAISCTICAIMFTTPVLLTSFGRVSLLAVLSNLLTVGVTAVCFICGLLICFYSSVLMPPSDAATAWLVKPLLSYILWAADKVSSIPFGQIEGNNFFGVAALFVFFATVLLWVIKGNKVKWKIILPSVCVMLMCFTGANVYYDKTHYTVTYLPCGSGQAIIISEPGHMALIDCGGDGGYHNAASSVREWMRWHGFKEIDSIVLTAVDKTHSRDITELLEEVSTSELLIPEGVKITKNNAELVDFILKYGARAVNEKEVLMDIPVTVFPVVDGKLGVLVGEHTLILHSPTQKQLSEFLKENECSASQVVLSERNLKDTDLLREALDKMGVESIMLQAGFSGVPETLEGRPVESPYISGEIQKKYVRGVNIWQ